MSWVYRESGFLDAATCAAAIAAMDAGEADEAEVMHEGFEVVETIRRARSIEVRPDMLGRIELALDGCRERLARAFGRALDGREGAGFVRYPDGGFYAPHVDRAHVASWPAAARRAVAVVVFLNGSREGEAGGAFDGGVLRIYGEAALDVVPRAGTLVAFRADLLHEVTEVRNGVRDVVVDWFYG